MKKPSISISSSKYSVSINQCCSILCINKQKSICRAALHRTYLCGKHFEAEASNCTDGWWWVMGGFVLQQGSGGDCYDYDRDLNGPNVNNASTEHLNV